MTILLILILALLRTPFVLSSSYNQTLLYGSYSCSVPQHENGINYTHSLHNLLDTLSAQSSKFGFYNFSSSGHTPGDQLFGLYFCRGDIDHQQCHNCVNYGKKYMVARVGGYSQEAVFWFDQCMVRYSNKPFLGKLDSSPSLWSWQTNITGDKGIFEQTLRNTMKVLLIRAAYGKAARNFATRVVNFAKDETLYALVQCSPDLSANDCHMCLSVAIKELRSYSKKEKVVGVNCMVRYETFPFFYSNKIKAMPIISPVLEDTNKTMVHLTRADQVDTKATE